MKIEADLLCELDAPLQREHARILPARILKGAYRLESRKHLVEIELIATSGARSIVYAYPGIPVTIFIPSDSYRLRLRILDALQADPAAKLSLSSMNRWDYLKFIARKTLKILEKSPSAWLALAKRFLQNRHRVIGAALAKPQDHFADVPPRPQLSEPEPRQIPVSVIIPTYARPELLCACITSLQCLPPTLDIIIIDNGACDDEMLAYLNVLNEAENIRVFRHESPFNFSQLCNLGAAQARFDTLLFLNDDVEFLDSQALAYMAGWLNEPDVGIVGARLLYPSRQLQHAGIAVHLAPGPGHPWRGMPEEAWRGHAWISSSGDVDAVTAACLMIRKPLFDRLGGFDEIRFPVTLNDVDLCLRVQREGYRIIYTPKATLIHKEGQTRKEDSDPRETRRRQKELNAFMTLWPAAAFHSINFPLTMRRDNDSGQLLL